MWNFPRFSTSCVSCRPLKLVDRVATHNRLEKLRIFISFSSYMPTAKNDIPHWRKEIVHICLGIIYSSFIAPSTNRNEKGAQSERHKRTMRKRWLVFLLTFLHNSHYGSKGLKDMRAIIIAQFLSTVFFVLHSHKWCSKKVPRHFHVYKRGTKLIDNQRVLTFFFIPFELNT